MDILNVLYIHYYIYHYLILSSTQWILLTHLKQRCKWGLVRCRPFDWLFLSPQWPPPSGCCCCLSSAAWSLTSWCKDAIVRTRLPIHPSFLLMFQHSTLWSSFPLVFVLFPPTFHTQNLKTLLRTIFLASLIFIFKAGRSSVDGKYCI